MDCIGCENKNNTIASQQSMIHDLQAELKRYKEKLNECQEEESYIANGTKHIDLAETDDCALELYASRIREKVLETIFPDIYRIIKKEMKNIHTIQNKSFEENHRNLPVTDSVDYINEGVDLNRLLEDYEKKLIIHALSIQPASKSQAAKFLNINRTTLIEKMKRLGL